MHFITGDAVNCLDNSDSIGIAIIVHQADLLDDEIFAIIIQTTKLVYRFECFVRIFSSICYLFGIDWLIGIANELMGETMKCAVMIL